MSERETNPAAALEKIRKIINSLNLYAVTHHTDCNELVATAKLFDNNHKLIESGAGKGPNSLIGALAESIEHFSTFHFNTDDFITQPCGFIASQKDAEHDGFLTSLRNSSEPITCLRLTTLDQAKELFVPNILLCPRMEIDSLSSANAGMQFLSRYSSNSGIAFGCTKAEALLHGTNEVIERHILSCFFMAVCEIGPAMKLYTPTKSLLTKALQNNGYALSLANKLQIIIIKDVMNVYFAVALPKSGPGYHHLSPIGSGCSLDICTAIQRAVTEQFQVNELYDDAQEAIDRKTLDFLENSKTLKSLIDFNSVKNLTLTTLDSPLEHFAKSVPTQLDSLEYSLLTIGKTLYYRVITQYADDGIVCQSYVPGLERFNLIRNGCLVAPQRILCQTTTTT
ncbi:YcaO-like family protein [Pseudomonas sp. PD9R]|uniref:YcaO-like family protein n=1 Tax=Pseudomonas sp. PD9R TaxID=2853534 RepID=UPI001C442FCF|nr:YcaO-like family protein [Pseudomonas sp. PD9R]MBV6822922.1 YcaO-like family protein [Pseudomonas sp. PD9R]